MAVQTDFIAAVNQIAAERAIDMKEVLEAISEAIETGFKQNFDPESLVDIKAEIDADNGTIRVVQSLTVVEKVTDKDTEISLKDAKKDVEDVEVGDVLEVDVTPTGDFGRVAAQAAKQVILQKIRHAERETQLKDFEHKIGEVEYAVVQRMDGDRVIWEVARTLAIMEAEDRIPGEFYKSGNRHKVLLKSIEETTKGRTLFVSRGAKEFLEALFSLEVPELATGSVEIKQIAREPGSRAKIAVTSNVDGIDPIGSFVGQRGIRINAIMNELRFGNREEKLDIILWDENEIDFIANAISPAETIKVIVTDEGKRTAQVVVPEDQLSLAIGKEGQNVRLAAKLTGWSLDIVSAEGSSEEGSEEESAAAETSEETAEKPAKKAKKTTKKATKKSEKSEDADELKALGLSTRVVNLLKKAGIETVDQLKGYKDFTEIDGIAAKSAEEIIEKLK
jgi:N utilization substance protein A